MRLLFCFCVNRQMQAGEGGIVARSCSTAFGSRADLCKCGIKTVIKSYTACNKHTRDCYSVRHILLVLLYVTAAAVSTWCAGDELIDRVSGTAASVGVKCVQTSQ